MHEETAVSANPISKNVSRSTIGETLAYGSGGFAEMMIFNPATTFMVFFYTDIAGIAAATVGTFMLFSRVFDLLNPAMGLLVDRTHSRFGKARPWLLWMAVPLGISAVLLFTAPALGPTGKVIYAFITYNLALTIIYPTIDVPYSAMLPLITPHQNQRTTLSLTRMSLAMTGGLVSFAITLPLVRFLGGGARGWQNAFFVFGAITTVLLLVCFFFTKERVTPASIHKAQVPIRLAIASLMRNKYWLLIAGLAVVLFLMMGLLGANLYYCRYFLHNVDQFGPLMTMYQITLIVGMVSCGPLIRKIGKRNTALLGTGVAILGQAMIYLAPTSFAMVATGTVIRGIGASPLVGTLFAMVADTIEYGEWKSGVRADGLAFGVMVLAMKIAIGIGNVLVGWILGLAGYVGGADVQSTTALFAIKSMFLTIPLALLCVTGIILWAYKLDQQYAAIAVDLKLRRDAAV